MVELLEVTTVVLVTLLALAAASALHWMLLRAACRLMQPATARPNLARVPSKLAVLPGHRR